MSEKSTLLPPVGRRIRHVAARRVHALRRGERELPTYFIVGAKRAGTTSLDEYVVDHPLVLRGLVEKGCRYYDVNYHRGPAWFRGHLPLVVRRRPAGGAGSGRGRSSGSRVPTTRSTRTAPARIAADVPGARIIFVLRDPVQRAWSHYRYEAARGLRDAVAGGRPRGRGRSALLGQRAGSGGYAHRHFSYAGRSRYAEALDRLHASFAPEQVLVVQSEALFADPAATLAWSSTTSACLPTRPPTTRPTRRSSPPPYPMTSRRCSPSWSPTTRRGCRGCWVDGVWLRSTSVSARPDVVRDRPDSPDVLGPDLFGHGATLAGPTIVVGA